jgi:hypothetical protein
MMAWLVAGVNLALLAATGLGAPAPVAVGIWEIVLAAALGFTLLLLAVGIVVGRARISSREQLVPLLLLPAFGAPVIISVVMAVLRGIPTDLAARSAIPYVAFLPVALLGLLTGRDRRPAVVTAPLLIAGIGQSLYLLGLFLLRVPDPTDTRTVWLARITLLDPRTTLPLLLAAALLPMAAFAASRGRFRRLLWALPIGLAGAAALSTQTRSQLVAVIAGVAAFAAIHAMWRAGRRGQGWYRGLIRGAVAGVVGLIAVVAILYAIPHTRALLQALFIRSATSVDTGRVANEWVPALDAVVGGGLPDLLAGMGSGQSFVTAGGEEQTYVHNLVLYGLVYFGAPGLCLILLGYALLVAGLWRRGYTTGDRRYFALAALVVALFVYAQFFAVHKLFSYNLMLMLAAQALVQPPGPAVRSG